MRRRLIAAAVAAACALPPASAAATPSASLHASLRPEIPGHTTTIRLSIRVRPGSGEAVPPPLAQARLRYPAGLDVQLSGLGIDACSMATLERRGPQGCPADSWMGRGHAVAQLVIKDEVVVETAKIAIVRAAERDGHTALMIVVYEEPALSAQIVLPAVLLPAKRPFGGLLEIQAPLLTTVPEGPDVSVTKIELVLGPRHLRYSERVRGRVVHYEPNGIALPGHCPRGGFRFAVGLRFVDGSRASAATAVRCPRGGRRRRGRRRA